MFGELGLPELIVIVVLIGLYCLPAIIAHVRNHENKTAIAVLNLFAGWTFVGWIVALVWAFVNKQKPPVIVVQK
jgi:hypothetical protein